MTSRITCQRDQDIATITLDNPGKRNAVNLSMWRDLRQTLTELARDDALRCVILRGAGEEAFAAGGDVEEFVHERATLEQALAYHGQVAQALQAVADCPLPTVALIYGACVGGGLEIAAACDLRICGRSARFGAPINRLGFSMFPGEMEGLLRLAGPAAIREMLLEGRLLTAAEAYAKGLVNRVVEDDRVAGEAAATARRIADGAPLVARWHKHWIKRLLTGQALTAEELAASFAFLGSEDYQEGLRAFLEKRPPRFKGR